MAVGFYFPVIFLSRFDAAVATICSDLTSDRIDSFGLFDDG